MVISYKKKFIFIHIIKTAGSSITNALEKYQQRVPLPIRAFLLLKQEFGHEITAVNRFTVNKWKFERGIHVYASDIRDHIGKNNFDKFFKFAFVRNPFDWLVSTYYSNLQKPHERLYELLRYLGSFEKYIYWRLEYGSKRQQHHAVCDENENIIVDFVGRFENLQEDFNYISNKLNLMVSLQHINQSKDRPKIDYRSYYTQDMIDAVSNFYKKDLEIFNYSFE